MTGPRRRSAREAFAGLSAPPPAGARRRAVSPAAEPVFGTVAGIPLDQRPRKTTVNLTLAEEDELEGLIRALRRRAGRPVSKDETWRALLVWAVQQGDAAAEALAELLDTR